MFGTKQVPAVGVSLGIERVFAIMEQLQKDQNQVTIILAVLFIIRASELNLYLVEKKNVIFFFLRGGG